jgi:uncharacterized membrane protein
MQRLSSKSTSFHKRVAPAVMVGLLLVLVLIGAVGGWSGPNGPPPLFFVIAALGLAAGLVYVRKLVLDLADEVWEDGDTLVVRNKGEEDRIRLSDIMNVSYSPVGNPPRVTLSLRTPSRFGDRLSFAAPVTIIPFTESPLIAQLIGRVDAARRGAHPG